jgi:peptidoglycan/LPS O-acetylase OafA/YrhL
MSNIKYRPDVDGLRAVAVILVLLFHASPKKYASGYIGVDVFFIISGYLITSILLKDLQLNRYSIKEFYLKRVRRIFPSLILVMLSTLIFGWFALTPTEFQNIGKHIASGALFVSNFNLWLEAGYFDTASEYKPLLHLWSLGIEEQFYIFWPLLLSFFFKNKRSVLTLITAIILCSFGLNIFFIQQYPSATFYLPHTRTWELLLGSLLSYIEIKGNNSDRYGPHKALAGCVLLASAILLINDKSIFPGWWAILPSLGTLLIISAGPNNFINRNIFGNKVLVYIGLLSYPLYLWHWPIFSYIRIIESGESTKFIKNAAILLSFILAALTYHFLEKKIKRKVTKVNEKLFVKSMVGLMIALLILGLGISITSSVKTFSSFNKLTPEQNFLPGELKNTFCKKYFAEFSGEFCMLSKDKRPEIALIGDSHAHSLYPGIAEQFQDSSVLLLGESACAPLLNTTSFPGIGKNRCLKEFAETFKIISKTPSIKVVIIHFRASTYAEPDALNGSNNLNQALSKTTAYLKGLGKEVIFIHQIPEIDFNPKSCADLRMIRLSQKNMTCSVSKMAVKRVQQGYRSQLSLNGIKTLDPLTVMCDEAECFAKKGDQPLYRDKHHLNEAGSVFLIKGLFSF